MWRDLQLCSQFPQGDFLVFAALHQVRDAEVIHAFFCQWRSPSGNDGNVDASSRDLFDAQAVKNVEPFHLIA